MMAMISSIHRWRSPVTVPDAHDGRRMSRDRYEYPCSYAVATSKAGLGFSAEQLFGAGGAAPAGISEKCSSTKPANVSSGRSPTAITAMLEGTYHVS